MPFQKGHTYHPPRSRLQLVEADAPADFGPIERWRPADFDDWLQECILAKWGGYGQAWHNKLASISANNDYLLIRNDAAVLLAFRRQHAFTGKPVVDELFCFVREEGADAPLRRRMAEWARSSGAEEC